MSKNKYLIATLSLVTYAQATADSYFEADGWPEEGIPVLINNSNELSVYSVPSKTSPLRKIRYGMDWRIPFDRSFQRTIKATSIVVAEDGVTDIHCGSSEAFQFRKGQTITYLQYQAEGYGLVKVDGRTCSVPVVSEGQIFGREFEPPVVEWWVRVTYADGTSPGWILPLQSDVKFGRREF